MKQHQGKEKEKRPWLKDKRSWIYYIEHIRKNEKDIVCGEVDDNVYMFDCETSRLSIWSKRWGAFAEVGADGLLKQAMSRRLEESYRSMYHGIKIFYKGIFLQDKFVKRDTELLNSVDIKKDLDRSYVNISRNGFTDKGERFFEEVMYPDLLRIVHNVLQHMAETAENIMQEEQENPSKNETFIDKICRIVSEISNNISKELADVGNEFVRFKNLQEKTSEPLSEDAGKLISLIVTVSVLAYYAQRDEWDIMEKLGKQKLDKCRMWGKLIDKINTILSCPEMKNVRDYLQAGSPFFDIKIYSSRYTDFITRGNREDTRKYKCINFSQIFQDGLHWAILQTRMNLYSRWTSRLVMIQDSKNGELSEYEQLITMPRAVDDDLLEAWGKRLFGEALKGADTESDTGTQFILNWLLYNVPTVGLFSDETGSIRVNVLSARVYPSVYLNKNIKYLILERMLERAKNEKLRRFSSIAWQGYEFLSCREIPYAMFFVKRGYMSPRSYRKVIVPFDGELLCIWKDEIDKEDSEFVNKVKKLWRDMDVIAYLREVVNESEPIKSAETRKIRQYLINSTRDQTPEIVLGVFDILLAKMCDNKFKPVIAFEELLEESQNHPNRWIEFYNAISMLHVSEANEEGQEGSKKTEKIESEGEPKTNSEVEQILRKPELDSLYSAWIYLVFHQNKLKSRNSAIDQKYEEYKLSHPECLIKENKILKYIEDHLYYPVYGIDLKAKYKAYEEELLGLLRDLESKPIGRFFDKELGRYKVYIGMMKRIYGQSWKE